MNKLLNRILCVITGVFLLYACLTPCSCKKDKQEQKKEESSEPFPGLKPLIPAENKEHFEEYPVLSFFSQDYTYILLREGSEQNLELKRLPGLYIFNMDGKFISLKTDTIDRYYKVVNLLSDGESFQIFPQAISKISWDDLKNEPDFSSFYHRENIYFISLVSDYLSIIHSVDQYLGGVHPFSNSRLNVLSLSSKTVHDFSFQNRNIREETSKTIKECLGEYNSVSPLEDRGGTVSWIAAFSHSVEACRGEMGFSPVKDLKSDIQEGSICEIDSSDTAKLPDGTEIKEVFDCRVIPDKSEMIILKKLTVNDRFKPVWTEYAEILKGAKIQTPSRELLYFKSGFQKPVIAGRARFIMNVQWLKNNPRAREIFEMAFRAKK